MKIEEIIPEIIQIKANNSNPELLAEKNGELQKKLTHLDKLAFNAHSWSIEDVNLVLKALPPNKILKKLSLPGFVLGHLIQPDYQPLRSLFEVLPNIIVTKLSLSNNKLDSTSVYLIARFLKNNKTLTHLDLSSNAFGCHARDTGAINNLWKALSINNTLHHLNLANTGVGDLDVQFLTAILKENTSLHTLILKNNYIGEEHHCSYSYVHKSIENLLEASSLLEPLNQHPSLRTLDLSHNHIITGHILEIIQPISGIHTKSISPFTLDLSGNPSSTRSITPHETKNLPQLKIKLDTAYQTNAENVRTGQMRAKGLGAFLSPLIKNLKEIVAGYIGDQDEIAKNPADFRGHFDDGYQHPEKLYSEVLPYFKMILNKQKKINNEDEIKENTEYVPTLKIK